MNTETIAFKYGDFCNLSVHIEGLRSLLRFLDHADEQLAAALRDGLRQSAQPVLSRARARAQAIQDDGTFAASLSIASRKKGSQWVLKSRDPQAGVKEFARHGAITRTSKGTPLANARLRARSGVGVPLRANAPRAMVPAVNESAPEVASSVERALAAVLEARHG